MTIESFLVLLPLIYLLLIIRDLYIFSNFTERNINYNNILRDKTIIFNTFIFRKTIKYVFSILKRLDFFENLLSKNQSLKQNCHREVLSDSYCNELIVNFFNNSQSKYSILIFETSDNRTTIETKCELPNSLYKYLLNFFNSYKSTDLAQNDDVTERVKQGEILDIFGIQLSQWTFFSWEADKITKLGALWCGYATNISPTSYEIIAKNELITKLIIQLQLSQQLKTKENEIIEEREKGKEKIQFLTHTAHDIRNHLGNIKGILDLLEDSIKDRNNYHLISIGKRNCEMVGELVEDILTISLHQSGKLTTNKIIFRVKDIIYESLDNFLKINSNKNENFAVEDTQDNYLCKIYADRLHIIRILINLITNSLKHAQGNNIVIKYGYHNIGEVFISIFSSGIEISEELKRKIFIPFNSSKSDKVSGLGLSICKILANANSGDLMVSSSPEFGTRFDLILPKGCEQKNSEPQPLFHSGWLTTQSSINKDGEINCQQ